MPEREVVKSNSKLDDLYAAMSSTLSPMQMRPPRTRT